MAAVDAVNVSSRRGNFLKILIIVVLVILLIFFVVTEIIFHTTYRPIQNSESNIPEHYEGFKNAYKREIVHFKSGDNILQGYIYGEIEEDKPLIVFSHGIWSYPEEYMTMLAWFLDRGYIIFAYDYTAYNGSEGKNARGLPQSALDQNAALTFIESEPRLKNLKKVTLGHSWGAYASTAGLNFDHNVLAACAMSGFNDPLKISIEAGKMMMGPIAVCMTPFVSMVNRVRFGKYHRLLAVDGINHANIPVLLTHGTGDEFIVYDVSSIICQRDKISNDKVSYITIDEEGRNGHNDFFMSKEGAEALYEQIDEFFKGALRV